MKTIQENLFRTTLFWDTDISKLDLDKNKSLIIERIVSRGTIDELVNLHKIYNQETIIDTIENLNYLDEKTINFLSLIYSIPKNRFKCYKKKQ